MKFRHWSALALLAAFSAGSRLSLRPPLYQGLAFSQAVYAERGRFARLLPAKDGKYRLWTRLSEISPLLVEATQLSEPDLAGELARRRCGQSCEGRAGRALLKINRCRLKALYSQDQILEGYLNLAPYGESIEGAGAASLLYFGKNPDQLTLSEALALSSVPHHPVRLTMIGRPNPDDERVRRGARRRLFKRWVKTHPKDAAQKALIELGPPRGAAAALEEYPDGTG